jgi:hypothetical protein
MAVTVCTPQKLTRGTALTDLVFTTPTAQADGFTVALTTSSEKVLIVARNNNAGSQAVTIKAPVGTNKTSFQRTADLAFTLATTKLGCIAIDCMQFKGADGLIRIVTGATDCILAVVELPS